MRIGNWELGIGNRALGIGNYIVSDRLTAIRLVRACGLKSADCFVVRPSVRYRWPIHHNQIGSRVRTEVRHPIAAFSPRVRTVIVMIIDRT
ncbi:hypothetical protein [Microcoleus sp. LEGE 07076]|uniref:hypothetical protein n=1 Tax=Microcoleus sp. LEGE 07076 TaxID=915322 RepID=UPI0030D7C50C